MKHIYLLKNIKNILFLLFGAFLLVIIGCSDDEQGWADERYLADFEYYLDHTNPLSGVEYTEEELAALSYDPREKESYADGQQVELTLISAKMPAEVKVLSGVDLSVISTLSSFTQEGDMYKSETFSSSLEDLGFLEIGDKGTIQFKIEFVDGSIGAVDFQVKRVKFFDPNAIIDTFVYLKKSTGETIPLRIDESVTSRTASAAYGNIVEFDGTSNKVEITDNTAIAFRHTDDYSIGFYVNTTSTDSDPVMIGDQDWGSSSNAGLTIAHRDNNWRVARADGATKADINHDGAYNDGDWHFLMVTFDRDGNMTMYQDGASVSSADMSAVGGVDSGNNIFIGQDGTGNYGQYFEGKIGNVYIYDYALSADQVAGVSTPLTGVQLKTELGVVKNISVANSGATATTENDRFTYEFDGLSQYATIDDADLGFRHTNDHSISFWVNTTSGDSDPVMIGDQDWGSSSNAGITIAHKGSSWRVARGDGSNKADATTAASYNDGDWHLVTVTLDRDGSMKLYLDASEVASEDMSAVGTANSGNPLRLAQDGTGAYGQFFQGKIADAVIYDYVLSQEQIAALIN